MEATRDQQIAIVNEGLRLVLACKVPQVCSSVESDLLLQVQQNRSRSLFQAVPPLLDWAEQHRQTLFDEEWGPTTLEFQQWFVLVYLEQAMYDRSLEFNYEEDAYVLLRRLDKFDGDIDRILSKDTNKGLRSSLFHYYERVLGLHGWECRPVELRSFCELFRYLRRIPIDVNLLFGQELMLFAVNLGKELLGFQQNLNLQKLGLKFMDIVLEMHDSEPSYAEDAEVILKMALHLCRQVADSVYDDHLWNVVYNSIRTIRDANPSLDDEIVQNLLTLLKEQTIEKRLSSYGGGTHAYLKALALLLLLDVPEVEVRDNYFQEITISGQECDWDEFLSHSSYHLQSVAEPGNLRFSIDLRLQIGQLIPKLFAGSSVINDLIIEPDYKDLDVLLWVTLFPIGQTEQQRLARGFMLKRFLDNMKRLCENVVKDSSHYALDQQEVHKLYDRLRDLLRLIVQGINQLPDEGRFSKLKWNLKRRMGTAHVEMKRMNKLVIREMELYDGLDDDLEL